MRVEKMPSDVCRRTSAELAVEKPRTVQYPRPEIPRTVTVISAVDTS